MWRKYLSNELPCSLMGVAPEHLTSLIAQVEPGGSIIVADSRNNRIIRFGTLQMPALESIPGSEPLPADQKCTLGGECQMVLRHGMPTSRLGRA